MPAWIRFFSFNRNTVKHASALLAITAIISNVLGLARNMFLYRLYGTGQLDAYFASFLIPDLLFSLLIFGAVTSVVIPFTSELISQGKDDDAHRLINQLITWTLTFFVIVAIVLGFALPWLVPHIVPGFAHDSRLGLTVTLSRIMLLQPILFAPSFTIGALLNAHRRFSSYSFAPLVYNLAIIIGAVASKSIGVIGVTWFVIVGALLHLAIQYREAWLAGFRLGLDWRISDALRQMWKLMLPPNLTQGFLKIIPFVYDRLASRLQVGSIAVYSGINNIQTTPTVVVANSLAAAFFPSLVAAITEGDLPKMNELLGKVIRASLFLLLPITGLSLVLRAQLIRLYAGLGGIDWHLTNIGIATFAWFMVGIIPASLAIILTRVFYAHKDTKTPMLIGVLGGIVSIATAFLGLHYYRNTVESFAIAEVAGSFVQAVMCLGILYARKYIHLPLNDILRNAATYAIGTILLALATWGSLYLVDYAYRITGSGFFQTDRVIGLLTQTVIAIVIGSAVYLAYSAITSKDELRWVRNRRFSSGT